MSEKYFEYRAGILVCKYVRQILEPEKLQGAVGKLIAEALTEFWNRRSTADIQAEPTMLKVCSDCKGNGGFQESGCGEGCCLVGVKCETCDGTGLENKLQQRKFTLTQDMKDALAKANKEGLAYVELPSRWIMFINRGEDIQDDSEFHCPYCLGSGHKGDIPAHRTPADIRAQTVAACQREIEKLFEYYPNSEALKAAINACLNVLENP